MKQQPTLIALLAAALTLTGGSALAHCGACGTGQAHSPKHSHSHAHQGGDRAEAASIVEIARDGGFSVLSQAIEVAGLAETLDGSGPYTVFAPTDEAFAKLPAETLNALLEDPEALKSVLLYHAVSGTVKAEQVVKLDSARTLQGESVAIAAGDVVMVNGAKVLKTDIIAGNGVIHVIDTVLVPERI